MDYKVYENVFSKEFVEELLQYAKNNKFQDGRVGHRVDPKQKIRKDLFIGNDKLIKDVDNIVYDKIYEDVKKEFDNNIKFRERWKIGWYKSDDGGYYNVHRDDIIATKHRKMSMTVALSDPSEYEGGEFYFQDLNKEFRLKKGDAIVFRSSVMHGVKPVTSGERYVLASFMFDNDGRRIKEEMKPHTIIKQYIPTLDNIKVEYDENNKKDIINHDYLKKEILESKGDIDYSDRFKNSLWTDKDDYYFEDNSGDTLLVLFAGMGWKDSIPTFIFYNFLKEYKNVDKLFLRDIACRYYLTGLKNSTKDLNSTIELLRNLTSVKKYKKIVALGCSAGGYAAILYGHLLQFTKVVVFSPQVVLNNKKTELIGDIYNAPKTCEWLINKNPDDKFYQKCLDLKNFIPFDTKVQIYYSKRANHGADKKHALYIESENCKIIEYNSNNHFLALELRDKGKLKEIIDELL